MTKEKRVHAMSMAFNLFCGTPGGNRTSLVKYSGDRAFWKIVTCERCLALRHDATRYAR